MKTAKADEEACAGTVLNIMIQYYKTWSFHAKHVGNLR